MKTRHTSKRHTNRKPSGPPTPGPQPVWRRRGNVARLPKATRDQINHMLDDGCTYAAIIESLGDCGKQLDESNLTRWKKGGYQDWLAEQAFIDRTRSRQETPAELVRDFDGTDVNHAALQLGSLHIFEALRNLRPGSLNRKLGGDCAAFARLLNALARASRETMLLQKYREACARASAVLHEAMDAKRKLSESETRAIVMKVDDILGLRSEEDDEDEAPNPESAESSPVQTDKPQSSDSNLSAGALAKAEVQNPAAQPSPVPQSTVETAP